MSELDNIIDNVLDFRKINNNFNPFVKAYLKGNFDFIFQSYNNNCTFEELLIFVKTCQIHGETEKAAQAFYDYDLTTYPDILQKYLILFFCSDKSKLLRDKILKLDFKEPIVNLIIAEDCVINNENIPAGIFYDKSKDIAHINLWKIENEINISNSFNSNKIVKYLDNLILSEYYYSAYRIIYYFIRRFTYLKKYDLVDEFYNKYLFLTVKFLNLKIITMDIIYFQAYSFYSKNDNRCLILLEKLKNVESLKSEVLTLKNYFIQNNKIIKKPVKPARRKVKEQLTLLV